MWMLEVRLLVAQPFPPRLVPCWLVDSAKEAGWCDGEAACELDDRVESWVSAGAFEERDLGGVEIAQVSERFLGELLSLSFCTQVRGELGPWFHVVDAR
jgi:hypothetical protein